MVNVAKIISVNDKIAIVEVNRKSACEGCHKSTDGNSCSVCGLMGGNKTITAKAKNSIGAKVGDRVEIESSSGRMLLYGLMIFVLPIVASLIAYFTAQALMADEAIRLISAFISFLSVFIIDFIVSKIIDKNRGDVIIVRII